jgi:hypothetical protein
MRLRHGYILLVCACAPAAFAQVGTPAFSQPPVNQPATGYFSDAVASQYYAQQIADNFTLSGVTIVDHVRFWGSTENFHNNDLSNIASFTIAFYSDSSGMPGAVVGNETFPLATTDPTPTGHTNPFGGDEFVHLAALATPITLQGSTPYWVSISATLVDPIGDAWVWTNSAADNVIAANFFTTPTQTTWTRESPQQDVAFDIIPAPGTLLAILVPGLLLRHRRTRVDAARC